MPSDLVILLFAELEKHSVEYDRLKESRQQRIDELKIIEHRIALIKELLATYEPVPSAQ